MLSTLVDAPFDSDEWLFEVKWDGFRAMAAVAGSSVDLYTRNHTSLHKRFPAVVLALQELNTAAIFDGEIVVLNSEGVSDFGALQGYIKNGQGDLRYYIFDLLYYQNRDLRALPLIERKKILQKLIEKHTKSCPLSILQYSDHVIGKGISLLAQAKKHHLEGIMAKELASPYTSTRSHSWLKIKVTLRQEALICGFTAPKGARRRIGALILGVYDSLGHLKCIGHVGSGFTAHNLDELWHKLQPHIVSSCPFDMAPHTNSPATWVKPKIICEVSFANWTKDHLMRQPTFLGIRDDKNPKAVRQELAMTPKEKAPKKDSQSCRHHTDLMLTHLEKVYWPDEGYTKGELLEYYQNIAPYLLPHLEGRPQILHRYPNGIGEKGFYQKNIADNAPAWIPKVTIQHDRRDVNYLTIDDVDALLYIVNLGCIDINPFLSKKENLHRPVSLVLDLDPEDISFVEVVRAALVLHELLDKLAIPSYCKTSGGRGLHIYIPLQSKYTFEQAQLFARLLSQVAHETLPNTTSLERSPKKRQKRVYFDFLRNSFGQSLVAPYAVRPRPGAYVSTPLEWEEVTERLHPSQFTIKNAFKRFEKKGDIFLPVLGPGIDIAQAISQVELLVEQ